jgi:hypothetical protein
MRSKMEKVKYFLIALLSIPYVAMGGMADVEQLRSEPLAQTGPVQPRPYNALIDIRVASIQGMAAHQGTTARLVAGTPDQPVFFDTMIVAVDMPFQQPVNDTLSMLESLPATGAGVRYPHESSAVIAGLPPEVGLAIGGRRLAGDGQGDSAGFPYAIAIAVFVLLGMVTVVRRDTVQGRPRDTVRSRRSLQQHTQN